MLREVVPLFEYGGTDDRYFEHWLPFFGTDGDKIGAIRAIVVGGKAVGVPSGVGFWVEFLMIHCCSLSFVVVRVALGGRRAGDHQGRPYGFGDQAGCGYTTSPLCNNLVRP